MLAGFHRATLMNRDQLLKFLQSHNLAVQSSVSEENEPQAAVIGFAVTDEFEFVFDTLDSTRKVSNLRRNPMIALTIGGLTDGDERTVQCNGIADEPSGDELDLLRDLYFSIFPDGKDRQSWRGITYVRVRPTWMRFSDFNADPPKIVEFDFDIE
jgi:nitroimidazol reductase NimA-like FMN-containing flavoprotein (pyridoxamine 5'-phosphate oxidase superfamily)